MHILMTLLQNVLICSIHNCHIHKTCNLMHSSECNLKVFGSVRIHMNTSSMYILVNTYPCTVYSCRLCPKFPNSATCYQSSSYRGCTLEQKSKHAVNYSQSLGKSSTSHTSQESDMEKRVEKNIQYNALNILNSETVFCHFCLPQTFTYI